MCECGCSGNNTLYRLPGPHTSVYLITLVWACKNCDGPNAVTIEQFESMAKLKVWCCDELPEEITLKKWIDSYGATIVTGRTKSEFVAAMKPGLIGLKSDDYGDKPGDALDDGAVEVILEEMYGDSTFTPVLVGSKK